MTRRAATFTQDDVARAIRAVAAAGRTPRRVELDPSGKIVVVFDEQPKLPGPDETGTSPAETTAEAQAEEERQWQANREKARTAAERAAKRRQAAAG